MNLDAGKELLTNGFRMMLDGLKEAYDVDLEDPNFHETPGRVAKAYLEMNQGADRSKIDDIFSKAFPSTYTGMIIETEIKTFSLCPHHFLPVRYSIDFAYIPKDSMLGLSKTPRFIKLLSQAPLLQEQLTQDIVDIFSDKVKPLGCAVIVEGYHLCMGARGVEMPEVATITSALKGNFLEDPACKAEFLQILALKKRNK